MQVAIAALQHRSVCSDVVAFPGLLDRGTGPFLCVHVFPSLDTARPVCQVSAVIPGIEVAIFAVTNNDRRVQCVDVVERSVLSSRDHGRWGNIPLVFHLAGAAGQHRQGEVAVP